MKFKTIIMTTAVIAALVQNAVVHAATVIGNYSMEATATLVGGQGMAYNGTSWYYGSGTSWQTYNGGWQSSAAPVDLSDGSAATFLADTSAANSLGLNLGFTGTHVVNGAGSDLVFFFLWDQSGNTANVTINGVTRGLSLSNVYNNLGQQLVVNGVRWNGATQSNVLLMAGELDLTSFGLLSGVAVNDPINISLTSNNTNIPMALSMVGALHVGEGSTVVPLPAPLMLMISGLVALGVIGRRKS
jgi:hypothetical protein